MAEKNKQMMTCTIILSVVIFLLLRNTKAQIETVFTQNTTFDISTQEGKIRFGTNGTYTSATLTNGTWSFTNLKLTGSQTLNIFKASARNSNITINSFTLRNTTLRAARLRYVAEGIGEQTFQMGIAPEEGRWALHPEWNIVANGVWLGEGEGWKITPDGTVTVKGAIGNVSIVHYNFLGLSETAKDSPLYEQHSVLIITIVFAGLIGILGTIVRLKTKRNDSQKAVNLNQEYVAKKVRLK